MALRNCVGRVHSLIVCNYFDSAHHAKMLQASDQLREGDLVALSDHVQLCGILLGSGGPRKAFAKKRRSKHGVRIFPPKKGALC